MDNSFMIGGGPMVVHRYLLTEGSGFTLPPKFEKLYSEVVTNEDGDEILELWLAIPTAQTASNKPSQTIFSKTTVYDDEAMEDDLHMLDEDDDDEPLDEAAFRASIENDIQQRLDNDDYDYDY